MSVSNTLSSPKVDVSLAYEQQSLLGQLQESQQALAQVPPYQLTGDSIADTTSIVKLAEDTAASYCGKESALLCVSVEQASILAIAATTRDRAKVVQVCFILCTFLFATSGRHFFLRLVLKSQ